MSQPARIRLRAIRFKDGREVRVFHPKQDFTVRDNFRVSASRIGANDIADKMAGWAIACWTHDGYVSVNFENGAKSPVSSAGVAQYVRDVLAAEQAVRWSRD